MAQENDTARPIWLTDEMCGWIYNALAQAYSSNIERADEFHVRWKAAPKDPVEVAAHAICGDDQAMEDRYISAGYHTEAAAALRALGMPG